MADNFTNKFQGERFKILFESNPLPMWIYDLENLKFLAVNDAAVLNYGYSREEFLKMTLKDIRPPEDVESLINNIHTSTDQYQWSAGWRHVKKDGNIIDIEILSHEIIFNNRKARLVTVNDVTEKKKAAEELRDAEYRYRTTIESMQEGFQIISHDWRYIYVNNTAARHGQSTRKALLGHTMMEVYPGIENTIMFSNIKSCMHNSTPHKMENEFIYPDGSKRWFYLNIEPVPEGILILSTDITNEKRAMLEVQRLNRIYAVLSNINQAIVRIKDKQQLFDSGCRIAVEDGKFRMAWIGMFNEKEHTISVASSAGNMNNFLKDIDKPSQQKLFWSSPASQAIKTGNYLIINDFEKVNKKLETWYEYISRLGCNSIAIFPLKTFNKVIGILGLFSEEKDFFEEKEIALLTEMVQDISFSLETMENEKLRLQAVTELKESETRFFNAFEYAAIGMAIVSLESNYMRVNNALCNMSGYSVNELIGKNLKDVTHPEDWENDLQQIKRMLSNEIDVYQTEKRYIHKTGRSLWIMLSSSLLRDNNGNPVYFITQIQDITERKKAEKEIIHAKERAEELNRLKSNFLANMSHELRTPMIGILGAAELMKESNSIDEIRELSEAFEHSANRLLRTLNKILDISKIESGQITLQKKEVALDDLIENALALFKLDAHKKNLSFNYNIQHKNIIVNLDEDLFINILNDLLHNAIKFTHEGGITIQLSKKIIRNSEAAEIIVSDTGIGIPKEKLNIIFKAFRQASEGYSRQHEGTGLGLTLAKKYTEMMNGTISVDSEIGKGTTFTLRFPLAGKSKAAAENGTEVKPGKDLSDQADFTNTSLIKVFYIDDDLIAHKFVEKFLEDICILHSCTDVDEGIRLLNKNLYDIVLIDINLGADITGVEFASKIRKIQNYHKIPFVAITSYAMKGDKEKFLKQGFDYYISKPFTKEQLREFVMKIFKENLNQINR
jgi:PAS domain S-box-containing protein